MLRILERDAGLTKAHVGGALAATSMTGMMTGAMIAPGVSSAVVAAFGFPVFTTYWAFVYIGLYLPCAIFLLKYNVKTGEV